METEPRIDRRLDPGDAQPIPAGVVHRVVIDGAVELEVDLLEPGLAPEG